jgi:CubicO group peptidase (beta-lactamase class C family)
MSSFHVRLIAALLLAILSQAVGAVEPTLAAADHTELEERISRILDEHKVPGMSVVVVERDGTVWTAGIGLADVATGRAVSPDTLFRVGSISKMFVGLAALKLVEEGRLDLQSPVHGLVPEVAFTNAWEATDPVRVVHLLEHSTGWDDLRPKEFAHRDPKPATLAEGLAVGPESRTSRWRPGTRFAYCNSGPAVMAAIIEKVTGKRFESYIDEVLLEPIGLPTADYFLTPRSSRLLTTLYRLDGRTPFDYEHIVMRPSGALNASATEMGAFLQFLIGRGQIRGHRILSEASLRRMERPTTTWASQGGLEAGYGLHNYTTADSRGFLWHGHNGGVDGGLSQLNYLPDRGAGYFFSINAAHMGAYRKIDEQLRAFVTRELGKPALPASQPVPGQLVQDYEGWYAPLNPPQKVLGFANILGLSRVSFADDRIRISSPFGPSHSLASIDGRRFRRDGQAAAALVLMESADGRLVQTESITNARLSPILAWLQIGSVYLFLLAVVSVPLFALVWGPRWAFRRMRGVPNLHVRVLPLLAVLSLAAIPLILMGLGEDSVVRLGQATRWSVGLTLATSAFGLFSAASLWVAVRADRAGMNRFAYFHSLGVSLMFALATLYLGFWGIIGIRTWA